MNPAIGVVRQFQLGSGAKCHVDGGDQTSRGWWLNIVNVRIIRGFPLMMGSS